MTFIPGTRIGPYEITAPIGEGGMGVVFRARDTQLLRDVALKLLPGHFADDPDRIGRFQREAQVLASLNHPNIAQIYGFQQTGTSGAIVMELVEGETLAERLRRGRLSIEEGISIAKQIVDALDAAHSQSIIHRDLKPANIKLTADGKVKVLDFGLAKALAQEDPRADPANSPTVVSGSVAGVIMGTAAYMSPEQARGSALDARTDIWAFGCVLYELLTSKPAFGGATATDIIAKVIEGQPNWQLLPAETPVLIRTLLVSTLAKERSDRLQHIDDARVFLNASGEIDKPQTAVVRTPRRLSWVTAVIAAGLLAALVPASLYFMQEPEVKPQIRFEMPAQGITNTPTISPDGQHIAYSVQTEGKTAIWIRHIGELKAQILSGTEGGQSPFWSPDSRYIGFFADLRLKKIGISGGPATVLAETPVQVPGAWNRDGVVLFSTIGENNLPVIARVSENGGSATPITKVVRAGSLNVFPQFLPDGRHFLYVEAAPGGIGESELYAASLDGGAPTRIMALDALLARSFPGRYAAPGYLMFVRNGVLTAQPFDAKRLSLSGEPMPIADQVGPFWVSDQGTVVYRNVDVLPALQGQSQLLWIDRNGKTGSTVGMPADFTSLRLSPDGHRLATDPMIDNNRDIWVIDLDRGVSSRLTFDTAVDYGPRWSPDGKRVVFTSVRSGADKIFVRSAIAIGGDESLPSESDAGIRDIADDWSPTAMHLVFLRQSLKTLSVFDIWVKPMSGDGKPFPYVQSKSFFKAHPRVSPNGRWLAYTTNESGKYQIVVQPFPDPSGGKLQISPDAQGGLYPTWRGDGRELYYVGLDGKMMAVPVKADNAFEPGQPVVLFQTPLTISTAPGAPPYDVAADGKRFIFIAPLRNSAAANIGADSGVITAIVNWTAPLKK